MDSRSQDRPSAEMLRQALGSSQEACPEPEILAAYSEGTFDGPETARYELHFSQCARCREQLAAMDRSAVALARGTAEKPVRSWHVLDWRWLAPAVAAILIVAIWVARRPVPREAEKPLLAVSQPTPMQPPKRDVAPLPDKGVLNRLTLPSSSARSRQNLDIQDRVRPGLIGPQPLKDQKKEFATNRPLMAANGADAIPRENEELKQNSGSANGSGVATAPRAVPPPAPAVTAPPADSTSQTEAAGGAAAGAPAAQSQVQQLNSANIRTKVDGTPEGQRTLAVQAQTQEIVQAQAMRLEAFNKRAIANVIASPERNTLWRISGNSIERSKDHGVSWKAQFTVANAQLTAGSAPDAETCWLVGGNGLVVLTTDAANWKTIPAPALADLVAVTAQDAAVATVTTANGRKFSTTDAGQHWTAVSQQPEKR